MNIEQTNLHCLKNLTYIYLRVELFGRRDICLDCSRVTIYMEYSYKTSVVFDVDIATVYAKEERASINRRV